MMWLVWTMLLGLNSLLHGCDGPTRGGGTAITGNMAKVVIKGKTFNLEIAADPSTRMKGLGLRTSIAEDGGMVFTFPRSQWGEMGFVMRDCLVDIDILYLDGAGRVLTMYTMAKEAPRGEGEGVAGDYDLSLVVNEERLKGDKKYEDRLKRYPSRYRTTFVIELQAGMNAKLGVKEGDLVQMDVEGLKRMAK